MQDFEIIDFLPEGAYFVGDVSNFISEVYIDGLEEIVNDILLSHESGIFKISVENEDGENVEIFFFFATTGDGDGIYFDQHKREYAVDSGTIGAISLINSDMEAAANSLQKSKMGSVIYSENEFEPLKNEDEVIIIDKVEIKTQDLNEYEYEEEDEESEYEDE